MISVTFEQVTKRFGATVAVNDVSLEVPAGSLFFLLGPSGCGKTTLLRMVAGFIEPSAGRVRLGDDDVTHVPPYKRDTGMVFQSYALWPHMTVGQNVAFGLDVRKLDDGAKAQRVHEALALVQMDHLRDRKPTQLSGGQQQRVALARALAVRPRCLLLDEPLSNLDAKLRLEMRSEIRRIVKGLGITTVYVTHDQKEALSMADGIAVLRDGKLEQTGSPQELYRQPRSRFVAGFIGESNFLTGTVEPGAGETITVRTPVGLIEADAGKQWLETTAGQTVTVAFRPEATVVAQGPSRDANTIGGRIASSAYLGELAEYVVELAEGTKVKAFELNPQRSPGDGQLCVVKIPREHVMLVPAEGAARAVEAPVKAAASA